MHLSLSRGRSPKGNRASGIPPPVIGIKRGEAEVAITKHDDLVKMREAGLSYTKIGYRLGITRERVRQILKGNPRPQKPALQSKVMLTTSEVAHLIGVRPNTVRLWSNKGILKACRIGFRRDRRFRREDVDGFLKKAEIK